jgi:3',5'-cyclic AMP phosphodiesterase CpdA
VLELIAAVHRIAPDVVAVSGDLTQRARSIEFEQARAFLDALPKPQIVVPGNHDVPMHNVYARFTQALHNYRRYITNDLEPFYQDEEIAVFGMNTARSLTIKGGRINIQQVASLEERMCPLPSEVTKIVVTHHPFDLPQQFTPAMLVGRAKMAMALIARCRVDLLLAGHYHVSHSGPTALRYPMGGFSSIFVQAGTACSTRGRGEANSFGVIRIDHKAIELDTYQTGEAIRFERTSTQKFHRTLSGWSAAL